MGYMRHHAILVTGACEEDLSHAHALATGMFPWVSPISPPAMNGYRSFFVPPDGSKEAWPDSDDGDDLRARFVEQLRAMRGSHQFVDWAEVQFGDEAGDDRVLRSSELEEA